MVVLLAAVAPALASTQAVGDGIGPPAPAQRLTAPGKWERQVLVPSLNQSQQVCTVLDGDAAAHADDITVWADAQPVATTLTINSPQQAGSLPAQVANFRSQPGRTEFDLRLPARTYSALRLRLAVKNFVARAEVFSGGRQIGSATLFDLSDSGHGLGSSTEIQVGEREDALLHVHLDRSIARGDLLSAEVPADRAAETLFTTVATNVPQNVEGLTLAKFTVSKGLPVERVLFAISQPDELQHDEPAGEFVRGVTVQAIGSSGEPDTVTGTIRRVHSVHDGQMLRADDLAIAAELPDNQRGPMQVSVWITNGTLPELPVRSVHLQMRERQLCFQAAQGVHQWRMFYAADSVALPAPGNRSLVQRSNALTVQLGRQQAASSFYPGSTCPGLPRGKQGKPTADTRLLLAVLLVITVLALAVALFLRAVRIPHVRR